MEKLKKYFDNKYLYIPIYVIIISLTMYLISIHFWDSDGYFIIASGEYILKNGIPKINPFTMVENLKIIIQQWSWDLYCAIIYKSFGNVGLYITCVGLYLLNFWAFRWFAKIKKVKNLHLTNIVILLILSNCYQFTTIRPTLVTTLLLILELCVLEKYKQSNTNATLLWLILISFIEINVHSAVWFLHFVFMLPYIVPAIKNPLIKFKESTFNRKPLCLVIVPMILVGFLNPYGLDGMLYIFYSYGDKLKSANIIELQSWNVNDVFGLIFLFAIFIVLYLLLSKKHIQFSSDMVYLFCGCSIMGFMYIRNLIYFFVGLACICIEFLTLYNEQKIQRFLLKQKQYTCALIWIAAVFSICFVMKDFSANNKIEDNSATPVLAIEYLEDNNVSKDVKIFTGFNNGAFFEFNNYKCFIDARPELYFKKLNKKAEVFDDYLKLETNISVKTYEKFLAKYKFDYLCIMKCTMFDTYMQTNSNYEIVLKADEYNLYKAK